MNGNTVKNWQTSPVQGFNRSALLSDPSTYIYYNASIAIDGKELRQYEGQYSTDVIRDFGLEYLEEAAGLDRPFFVGIAPIGPHSETITKNGVSAFNNPVPADRDKHLFSTEIAPQKASFNPVNVSGASYVEDLPRLNNTVVDYLDKWYRDRLRSLRSVDELVDAMMQKAKQLGILDNTYFIYTSDNGYSDESVYSNSDLTATIVHKSGAEPTYDLEGRVMDWSDSKRSFRESGTATYHLSEFWVSQVGGAVEGKYTKAYDKVVSKYRTLWVKDEHYNLAYTVWCTGQRELYNMKTDLVQMNNLLKDVPFYGGLNSSNSKEEKMAARLDSLLLSLKTCQGSLCRRLWYNLFPEGEVQDFEDALQFKWDSYFDELPHIHFDSCRDGFFPAEELPVWQNELVYMDPSLAL